MKSKKYISETAENEDKFAKTFSKLDLEISRKIYHVVILIVIVCYLFVGYTTLDAIYNFALHNLPQPPQMPPPEQIMDFIVDPLILEFRAGHLLMLMAVAWIFIILLFTDIVRIKRYRYYPIKMLAKIYRDKERLVLAPHVYLTTGILFALVLSDSIASYIGDPVISPHIIVMTLVVSALADAVATIIGITKGKHHLKGGKGKKTWEGLIAGVIAAFFLGMISYIIIMLVHPPEVPPYGGTIGQAIVFSLVGAAVIGLIDFFSPPIPVSDNLLNPVIMSLALWGVYFLFYF
jgi:dolichol kinase